MLAKSRCCLVALAFERAACVHPTHRPLTPRTGKSGPRNRNSRLSSRLFDYLTGFLVSCFDTRKKLKPF
jgi:hypothetical protein